MTALPYLIKTDVAARLDIHYALRRWVAIKQKPCADTWCIRGQEFRHLLDISPKCKSSCLHWTWKPPWSLAWEGAKKKTATDWRTVQVLLWKQNKGLLMKKQDRCVLGALQLKVKVCAEAKALTETWCGHQNWRAARNRALQNNC